MNLDLKQKRFDDFRVGDSIEVGLLIQEGKKERIQNFAGDVIAFHRNGIATTFTVRKVGANGIGVEKIFPYYSPSISSINIKKYGKVRRSKLFYIRSREGKATRIAEKIMTKEQKKALKQGPVLEKE
ncbi:50S ribosomal protein L19 [Candidatus Babeliales bacterium]|nr:50S ribosomal protein L19 [Candidatus Babeliales bacterium]